MFVCLQVNPAGLQTRILHNNDLKEKMEEIPVQSTETLRGDTLQVKEQVKVLQG